MSDVLFDMEPTDTPRLPELDPPADMSSDQKRTWRDRQRLARGWHPNASRPLHPDAPRVTEPGEPGDGPRCRSCAHLLAHRHNCRTYFKCQVVGISHGPATDVRRWWPACTAWKPREDKETSP